MTKLLGETLASVSITKTRTGMKIDVELSGSDSLVEDISYLMIIERTARMKQKDLSKELSILNHEHDTEEDDNK